MNKTQLLEVSKSTRPACPRCNGFLVLEKVDGETCYAIKCVQCGDRTYPPVGNESIQN